jgi:hypothetical protein
MMIANRVFVRVSLLVLAAAQGTLGLWAVISPRGLYDNYPGAGFEWVSALPPYNEHLVRDVGSLSIGLALASLLAALWTERRVVQVVAVAWLAWAIPHIAYHTTTTEAYSTRDNVLSLLGLALEVLVPIALLIASRGLPPKAAPPSAPPVDAERAEARSTAGAP